MVMLMRYHDASTPSLKAQSHDGKLQPLIQYLKDETLPNDAQTAEKLMHQEGQYFLSDHDILYKQSYTAKKTVIQL